MATIKPLYAAPFNLAASLTALASLATSSGLTAGWQSDIIDNRTNLYDDVLISGIVRVGTTPTVNTQINIYAWSELEDTGPSRPDSFGTTAAARSITSAGVGQGYLRFLASLNVDATTTDRDYPFGMLSLAALFGGTIPPQWGLWIVHNTGVALNATSTNFKLYGTGIQIQSV